MRILLVERYEILAAAMIHALELGGHEVMGVADDETILSAVEAFRPDLVVMGLHDNRPVHRGLTSTIIRCFGIHTLLVATEAVVVDLPDHAVIGSLSELRDPDVLRQAVTATGRILAGHYPAETPRGLAFHAGAA